MKRVAMLAVGLFAATGVGCANARYVQKNGDEGVISVKSNTDTWPEYNRTNAVKLIESHVGPNYEIVEEKEVVTGQVTNNTQNTKREATMHSQIPFLPAEKETTTSTTTAQDVTEWHIHYRKRLGSVTGFPATGAVSVGTPMPGSGVVQTGFEAPAASGPINMPVQHQPASVSPAAMVGNGTEGMPAPNLDGIR